MIYWSTFEKFDSLVSLASHFKDNKTCKEFLVKQRWADGIIFALSAVIIIATDVLTVDFVVRIV